MVVLKVIENRNCLKTKRYSIDDVGSGLPGNPSAS